MHWLLLVVIACCPYVATSNYLLVGGIHRQLSVPIGRRIHLSPSDLGFNQSLGDDEPCAVEVTLGEAITQRVGRFQPEVFDCQFSNGSVYYSHFGSRLLDVDIVRLRVIRSVEPTVQPIEIHFHILMDVPYETVTVNDHLFVPGFFSVSQPVDDRVLSFTDETCRVIVRLAPIGPKWPKYGQLIYGKERTALDEPLEASCLIFPHLNLRYEHLSPPTPDVDHIDLLIESHDDKCPICIKREWVQLTVVINEGRPNRPPKVGAQSTLKLNAEVFEHVIITSKVLSAVDDETAATNLIFNVTQQPQDGYFHFVSNPTTPLGSFSQRDIIDHRLAFTATEPKNQSVTIDVVDELSMSGKKPIVLSIKASDMKTKDVAIVSGLIVFEGQSARITSKNIKLKFKSGQPRISFQVLSGPHYGNLTVDARGPLKFFYWYDIEWESLLYTHDGSDTLADEIQLLAGQQRLRFPIAIVPTDDSPPNLDVNVGMTIDEGRTVVIGPETLKAVDPDTSDEQRLNYEVIRNPQGGYLLRKLQFQQGYIRVTNFTQKEVDDGLIVYTHANAQLFLDEFQVVLKDDHCPIPNESPMFDVSVEIRPLENDPPRPLITATFQAIVKETEILHLDRNLLGFINKAAREDDIYYNITSTLTLKEGKFVLSPTSGSKDELVRLPQVTSFTQIQVNKRNVVYIPPWSQDIGPHLLRFHLNFTVADASGNVLPNHQFHITVLPVDDKKPTVELRNVTVGQGQSCIINVTNVNVIDEDTEEDDITLRLMTKPVHGSVTLANSQLSISQPFTLKDIKESLVSYVHRGLNLKRDSLTISVSDGRNEPMIGVIGVNVRPVETSAELVEPTDNSDQMVVSVMEKDLITIPMELLAIEPEFNLSNVHYAIVKSPHHGSVLVRGHPRDTFTQNELANGEVQYIHDGVEIGHQPQLDDMWLTVSDGLVRGRSGAEAVHSLRINIIPVDNAPPRLTAAQSIQVFEGGRVLIKEDNLVIKDDDSTPEHLMLVVAKQPLYGLVLLDDKVTRYFRMNHLLNGRVSYAQTNHRWLEQRWDSMVIYATDGVHRSESVKMDINITMVNDEPPQIKLKNFSVAQRSSKILDRSILTVADLDWPPDNITISLLTPPSYGRLVVGQGSSRHVTSFTRSSWIDWERLPVSYVHVATHLQMDQFTLAVSDGRHEVSATVLVNVTGIQTQIKPPEIVKVEITSPETLEDFGDGLYGFVFTRHHIKLYPQMHLSLRVVSKPSNGRLENASTGQKDISSFEIKDLYNEHVRYVILQPSGEKDSFTLSTANSNTTHRVNLVWSVIYFKKSNVKVCENVGVIPVTVYRSSNVDRPAFVDIRAEAGTASEPSDFRPSRIRQLQFNSGVSSLSWEVNIVDDDSPDTDQIETFSIRLSDPVNAVILPHSATLTVHILDKRQGSCHVEDKSPVTAAITDTVTNPQECSQRNSGQKLVINYGVTKIVLICDGDVWKSI